MQSKFFSFLLELVKTVAIVFVLAWAIRHFFLQPFVIEGRSMEPSFHDRQLILIDKISYKIHSPHHDDVIVFESPQNPSIYYIKRVIGLPGQHLTIKDGFAYLDGQKISEPYLAPGQKTTAEGNNNGVLDEQIPNDEFFVMGDNRDQSSDSREWGLLKKQAIVGRLWVVLYPRTQWYSHLNQFGHKFAQAVHQHSYLF